MRFVTRDKDNVPPELGSAELQSQRYAFLEFYALPEKERAQTTPPTGPLGKEFGGLLLPPLLDLFQGKCAFCEQADVTLQPYQFRPPAFARTGTGQAKDALAWLNFSWLAYAWENLYPICDGCMPEDPTYFPTQPSVIPAPEFQILADYVEAGQGRWGHPMPDQPVLIDPCAPHELRDHFRMYEDGYLVHFSARGQATAAQFRLNRPELVERRQRRITDYLASVDQGDALPAPDPATEFSGLLELFRQDRSAERAQMQRLHDRATAPAKRPRDPVASPFFQLRDISISNYRALENLTFSLPPRPADRDMARALLILGENATGKSSLLEAIAQALVSSKARGLLGEKASAILLNPKYMGCDDPIRARAEVNLTLENRDGETRTVGLSVTRAGGKRARGDRLPDYPIYAYGAYRHYRKSVRSWRADRGVRNLFHSDDLLSNPERWLLGLDERTFDMVIAALRDVIGGGFNAIDREGGDCFVVIREPAPVNADGTPIPGAQGDIISRAPLDTLSSGFRTILALTCDMMRWLMARDDFTSLRAARGLCMIDEVEAHLHPRWKVSVMSGLRRAFPGMTFIVTTHDPLCIRGMLDGEVMVLQRQKRPANDQGLPVHVDMLTELPDVTKLTIEQLLTSDFFDLFDTSDAGTSVEIAEVASILALYPAGQQPANPRHRQVIDSFRREINDALPVGTTAAARIVQDAVAAYLIQRRDQAPKVQTEMRQSTINAIIQALEASDAQN